MRLLGADFAGGLFRRGYQPSNPAGLWYALAVALVLLVIHQLLQVVLALGFMFVLKLDPALMSLFKVSGNFGKEFIKAGMVAIFPASLLVAAVAYWLAGLRGGDRVAVLNLRWPRFTLLGWLVLVIGFMLAMYAVIFAIVLIFHIDMSQYTPGPHGESPKTGSAGAVKEAMFDISNTTPLYLLVFPSVAIGAPLAEELIFRGQLFSALSRTRLGVAGTSLVTSGLWAMLHVTEPWLSIGLIFAMGLIFGWMMWRFGSIWLTIACHGIWNGFYALLIYFHAGGGV